MPLNGRPAPAGEGLLGLVFVFVFSSSIFFVARFESLGLHGFGCKLVCALHEHAAHTLRRLDKKIKNTNLSETDTKGVKFSRG